MAVLDKLSGSVLSCEDPCNYSDAFWFDHVVCQLAGQFRSAPPPVDRGRQVLRESATSVSAGQLPARQRSILVGEDRRRVSLKHPAATSATRQVRICFPEVTWLQVLLGATIQPPAPSVCIVFMGVVSCH